MAISPDGFLVCSTQPIPEPIEVAKKTNCEGGAAARAAAAFIFQFIYSPHPQLLVSHSCTPQLQQRYLHTTSNCKKLEQSVQQKTGKSNLAQFGEAKLRQTLLLHCDRKLGRDTRGAEQQQMLILMSRMVPSAQRPSDSIEYSRSSVSASYQEVSDVSYCTLSIAFNVTS